MVFTAEDRILIKNVYLFKGYNCMRLLAKFPEKNWKKEDSKNCCTRSAKLLAAIDVWDSLEQSVIDDAIDQWRSRLRVCVRAKGGHFEQSVTCT